MEFTIKAFRPEMKVTYFDFNGPKEHGIVSSINDYYVFVKYYRNGVLQGTAQATKPDDLKPGHITLQQKY
jgi:hypothetical protein